MLPWTVTEKVLREAAELRAFYETMGITPKTAERAVAMLLPAVPTKPAGGRAPASRRKSPGRQIHRKL
jgi:hypothetical protein